MTFEVIKHRLWQINDEQGTTIRQISSSPIVTEANDFNVGLFTAAGELVSAGPYVLLHLTTMDDMISAIGERATAVREGDVFLCNDPALGALHQSDVAIVAPVFRDGDLVAWFSNTLHQVDVGGVDRGSFCISATDTFDEPPRLFLKLVDEGEWSREVEYTYYQSSRFPESLELNLRAQTAAINVAKSRFREVCDEYGVDAVCSVMADSINYAESELRDLIAELPDGKWTATGHMDGDGHTDAIYTVETTLAKRGDQFRFDYSGTDAEAIGGLNATLESCYAGTTAPVYAFLCQGDIDWNAAVKRTVSVDAPPGSVANASDDAGVSIASVGFTWLIAQVAAEALANCLLESSAHRDRACASWLASWNSPNVFGTTEDGAGFGTMLSDGKGGGASARTFADGFEHAGSLFAPRSKLSNVEDYERKFPLRYICRSQTPDSGGAGRYRGGCSLISVLTPHRAADTEVIASTFGSEQSPAHGLSGGYPGGGAQVSVAGIDDARRLVDDVTAFHDLDRLSHHPPKGSIELEADQAFLFYAPGGGGYGDPLGRPPSDVESDVRTGRVTRGEAERVYGVVFDGEDDPEIDAAATDRRRRHVRERRMAEGDPAGTAEKPCPSCGDTGVAVRHGELGELGPWVGVRYRGAGPNFVVETELCSACGELRAVTQVRRRKA